MRELSEYTEELHRRVEMKIETRRQHRRRALTVCVPLALVLVISAAAILPGLDGKASKGGSPENTAPSGIIAKGVIDGDAAKTEDPEMNAEQDLNVGTVLVELCRSEADNFVSAETLDPQAAARVYELIRRLDPGIFSDPEGIQAGEGPDQNARPSAVQLLLTDPEGRSESYTLENRSLLRGELRFELTEEDYQNLLSLLGLEGKEIIP